jgi:hypothetical protein
MSKKRKKETKDLLKLDFLLCPTVLQDIIRSYVYVANYPEFDLLEQKIVRELSLLMVKPVIEYDAVTNCVNMEFYDLEKQNIWLSICNIWDHDPGSGSMAEEVYFYINRCTNGKTYVQIRWFKVSRKYWVPSTVRKFIQKALYPHITELKNGRTSFM